MFYDSRMRKTTKNRDIVADKLPIFELPFHCHTQRALQT